MYNLDYIGLIITRTMGVGWMSSRIEGYKKGKICKLWLVRLDCCNGPGSV